MIKRTPWAGCGALALLLVGCTAPEAASSDGSGAVSRTTEQTLTSAPDSDCGLHTYQGRDYWFCDNHRTWDEARARCEAQGLHLVRIDDASENAFVDAHAFGDTWIGATDAATEGEWLWTDGTQFWSGDDDGSPVGGLYNAWDSGEPDISSRDCAQILGDEWIDDTCSDHEEYICEEPEVDQCPNDPSKTQPGGCGCGVPDVDSDGDGTLDCVDLCPNDATKVAPGDCGCSDDPKPIGTYCGDGPCPTARTCDGAGQCGDLNDCKPEGNCTFAEREGTTYWFCETDRSWAEARDKCRAVGMDLAQIESDEENTFVKANLREESFIGATDAKQADDWRWAATQSAFWTGDDDGQVVSGSYANWDGGEPRAGLFQDKNCAEINLSGDWNTEACSGHTEAYVCEERPGGAKPGAPSTMCDCPAERPCHLNCAGSGSCPHIAFPVTAESTCTPVLLGRPAPTQQATVLLGGCGYYGIRTSTQSRVTGKVTTEERWYEPDTGTLVGQAVSSGTMDLAGATSKFEVSCAGQLPPADCSYEVCNPCNETGETCNAGDVDPNHGGP